MSAVFELPEKQKRQLAWVFRATKFLQWNNATLSFRCPIPRPN